MADGGEQGAGSKERGAGSKGMEMAGQPHFLGIFWSCFIGKALQPARLA